MATQTVYLVWCWEFGATFHVFLITLIGLRVWPNISSVVKFNCGFFPSDYRLLNPLTFLPVFLFREERTSRDAWLRLARDLQV
jgi:hypothetical protein